MSQSNQQNHTYFSKNKGIILIVSVPAALFIIFAWNTLLKPEIKVNFTITGGLGTSNKEDPGKTSPKTTVTPDSNIRVESGDNLVIIPPRTDSQTSVRVEKGDVRIEVEANDGSGVKKNFVQIREIKIIPSNDTKAVPIPIDIVKKKDSGRQAEEIAELKRQLSGYKTQISTLKQDQNNAQNNAQKIQELEGKLNQLEVKNSSIPQQTVDIQRAKEQRVIEPNLENELPSRTYVPSSSSANNRDSNTTAIAGTQYLFRWVGYVEDQAIVSADKLLGSSFSNVACGRYTVGLSSTPNTNSNIAQAHANKRYFSKGEIPYFTVIPKKKGNVHLNVTITCQ